MSKTTIKFYPNDRKRSSKTQKTPVYMIVTKDGVKTESRLDWELTAEERELWNWTMERVDFKETYTNTFLQKIELRFTKLKLSDTLEINDMSAHQIKEHLLGIETNLKKGLSIYQYAKDYYDVNIDQSTRFADATKVNYRKALNHLKAFVEKQGHGQGHEHKRITSLDFDFANKFSAYLMSSDIQTGRVGMSEVSACGIIKKFRTIYTQAVHENLISPNPFMQIKLSYKSPEKPKVTLIQVRSLIQSLCEDVKTDDSDDDSNDESQDDSSNTEDTLILNNEQLVTRLFLLMGLTGCAFVDFVNLTAKNIEKIDDHNYRLIYKRQKTGLESQQILTGQALSLFEKLAESPDVQTSEFLVPRISNQHFNRTLKAIAEKNSIYIKLTTHTARHLYRELLDEADIVDPSVVHRLMGWSSQKGMDSIYRRVTDTRLIKTKEQFEGFLSTLFK